MILVHPPPFRESSMHEGAVSNDDNLPFFSSKVTGEVLRDAVVRNPEIDF